MSKQYTITGSNTDTLNDKLMKVIFQENDFKERSSAFKEEYFELCRKHQVFTEHNPYGAFDIVDTKDWSGTPFEIKE